MSWEIESIEPKEASREDWTRFHAYRRLRHEEHRPEDPLWPDDQVEAMMKKDSPESDQFRFVVRQGDEFIGSLNVSVANENYPGYESNKHLAWTGGAVLGPHRRRGIGTELLRRAAGIASEQKRSVVTMWTEEDDGHAFLKAIGAEGKQAAAENRLDLHEVDWDMVVRWVKEGPDRSPDTKLEFIEPKKVEDLPDDYLPRLSELLNTMPFDDLDHGDIIMSVEGARDMYERIDALNGSHFVYFTREPDGIISGITDTFFFPSEPDRVGQGFTGVHPDSRGRGLGKWLKAVMLQFVRERYPEARWIVTGNANSNAPMLAINNKLGFKEHKPSVAYQISLEDIKKFLQG